MCLCLALALVQSVYRSQVAGTQLHPGSVALSPVLPMYNPHHGAGLLQCAQNRASLREFEHARIAAHRLCWPALISSVNPCPGKPDRPR